MKYIDKLLCLVLLIIASVSPLFADSTPNPYSCVVDPEFANTDLIYAPLATWAAAGSNSILDPLIIREIDVSNIEPIVCLNYETSETDTTTFASAIPDDDLDDSGCFKALIDFLVLRKLNLSAHVRIYIPPGTYNFSDQLVMHSNISLKGAGSDVTELRFLIQADSIMTQADCRKDAINVSGTTDSLRVNVGIEDLKIIRERGDDLSRNKVYEYVGGYSDGYWGNNIAIRRATNCWVKGVESENTFRNHVTLEFAEHITVSGVYFYDAIDYGDGGYGYGVGIWNSSSNKVENSIFKLLRHGVHELTMVYFPGSVPKLLPAKLMAVYLDNPEAFDGNVGLVKQNKYQISDFHKSDG